MSLVGTRPILQDELQKYELHHRARIAIKPGITGMWQVSGRSDIVDIISDVNMAYSEHARRYLADTGLPKERTYVTGSPMAEVLHQNLEKIVASDMRIRMIYLK